MDEVDALRLKLSRSKSVWDVIDCIKIWRDILLKKSDMEFRTYQMPLSDKIIEFRVTEGALGNEIVTLWCRQSGKTETVSFTVLVLGTFYIMFLREDINCGLFAPVESMITHVTRNRLRTRFKKLKKFLWDTGKIKQIAGEGLTSSLFVLESMVTDKEFTCRSLSVGEQAEIIGETFGLMIIEQSELVNAMKLKTDVFPMGAEKGGIRVLTGTTSPYFKNEYFRQAIEKWNPDPRRNRSTADFLEVVDWKLAAESSPAYRRYVEQEKRRLGSDSIEFRTQYCLEWLGAALKFIGFEKLTLQEKDYIWDKERLRFFGIDVARAGDSTVVTVIELNGMEIYILGWLELEGLDFENQFPRIVKFLKEYQPLRFGVVDVPGMGVALYDMLKKRLWDEVLDAEGKVVERVAWARLDGFYGSKTENDNLFKCMDREFQHGRIYFPKTTKYLREKAKFVDQLLDLERHYLGHSLKLQAPKIKGRHDDYPLSLALALYALKEKSFKTAIRSINF
jgi:hypothetical protein